MKLVNRINFLCCLISLFGCSLYSNEKHETKKNIKDEIHRFLKSDYTEFKNYKIQQSVRCLISFSDPDNVNGIFTGLPSKDEVKSRFDRMKIYDFIQYCRTNNIYSFKSERENYIIKTNNFYYSYNDLKKADSSYFDYSMNLMGQRISDIKNLKQSLCYLIGNNEIVLDSIAKQQKVYNFTENVYYFWTWTPEYILECNDGLIR